MRFKTLWLGTLLVLICAGLAFADICPVCGKVVPEDEKYCDLHKVELQVEQALSLKEEDLVGNVKESREEYSETLNTLKDFYTESGNRVRLEKVLAEIEDLEQARTFNYQNWEDLLPDLTPEKEIPEARQIYNYAEGRRKAVSFTRKNAIAKKKKAVAKYRELIETYPDCNLVDEAAFRLGEIHEGKYFDNPRRAAKFFEYCFHWNFETDFPARYRAARIYEHRLQEYDKAANLYWLWWVTLLGYSIH